MHHCQTFMHLPPRSLCPPAWHFSIWHLSFGACRLGALRLFLAWHLSPWLCAGLHSSNNLAHFPLASLLGLKVPAICPLRLFSLPLAQVSTVWSSMELAGFISKGLDWRLLMSFAFSRAESVGGKAPSIWQSLACALHS